MIRVLVVDDSTLVRKILLRILEKHPQIETFSACNGEEALEMIQKHNPDVITMDIEMPVMDGLTALQRIMKEFPRPVIMLSALTGKGTMETIEALKLGAVDCIPKINAQTVYLAYVETELVARILYFGNKNNYTFYTKNTMIDTSHKKNAIISHRDVFMDKVVLIGASTGGPLVLQHILSNITNKLDVTIIVALHMPKGFSASFVERLTKLCAMPVKLIENDESIQTKTIYVCCGGYQTIIQQKNSEYVFKVFEDSGEHPYRPSIDVLFSSVASLPYLIPNTMAFILTGMGHDGLEGSTNLYNKGVKIYAQDEKSSVVFGMPKAVISAGIAKEVPLDDINAVITKFIT